MGTVRGKHSWGRSREMPGLRPRGRTSTGPSGHVKKPMPSKPKSSVPNPEGAMRKARAKEQSCPVDGCTHRSAWLKRHIYEHLPPVFRPLEGAGDPDQLALPRVAALRYLSRTILGTGGDLNGLVRFVNQEWDGPCGPITPEWEAELRALTTYMGWPMPTQFHLRPLDSPAGLMHYRPLSFLLNCLTGQQKVTFGRLDAMPADWPQTTPPGGDRA